MKKKNIWLLEIIIWLFVLSGIFYFCIYNSAIKENARNTYYLFFDDVEGLVKGSPVRLMGINIGYIRDIKIFDNKVFVSFLVTKDNVKIPNMATASIEFYGLGGSTSLELNPSTSSESSSREAIIPSKSYRVQDFWDGQKLVANVMIDIYGGIGRSINAADLINNKSWFKQSALVNDIAQQTGLINNAQSVMIFKLTESTFEFSKNKQLEIIEEEQRIEEEQQQEEVSLENE